MGKIPWRARIGIGTLVLPCLVASLYCSRVLSLAILVSINALMIKEYVSLRQLIGQNDIRQKHIDDDKVSNFNVPFKVIVMTLPSSCTILSPIVTPTIGHWIAFSAGLHVAVLTIILPYVDLILPAMKIEEKIDVLQESSSSVGEESMQNNQEGIRQRRQEGNSPPGDSRPSPDNQPEGRLIRVNGAESSHEVILSNLFLTYACDIVFYVMYPVGMSCGAALRYLGTSGFGFGALMLPLAVIWVADTCALIAGSTWGRVKFCEAISPNKTWEGFFAMFPGGITVVSLYFAMGSLFGNLDAFAFGANIPFWILLAIGTLNCFVGAMGDLCESTFKRLARIKDSSAFFGAQGGVFDKLDSSCPCFVVTLIGILVVYTFINGDPIGLASTNLFA